MRFASFERFAGLAAVLAGLSGLGYALAFIVLRSAGISALFLLLLGLLSTAVWVALYHRLREADASFALWALLLGVAGALGAAAHGGYDLATAFASPASLPADLP